MIKLTHQRINNMLVISQIDTYRLGGKEDYAKLLPDSVKETRDRLKDQEKLYQKELTDIDRNVRALHVRAQEIRAKELAAKSAKLLPALSEQANFVELESSSAQKAEKLLAAIELIYPSEKADQSGPKVNKG